MDLQQATQAYLWGLPLVSFAQWQYAHETVFGAHSGDLVLYQFYEDKLGILTANATTPYIIAFIDLSNTGPMVLEMPPGHIAGGLGDFWQREMGVMGEMGPRPGKRRKVSDRASRSKSTDNAGLSPDSGYNDERLHRISHARSRRTEGNGFDSAGQSIPILPTYESTRDAPHHA